MAETTEKPKLRTFEVEVRQTVLVKLDPAKFTPAFLSEFRESFFPLYELDEHAEHLAQLAARGVAELSPYLPKEFVEGYGPIGEMGISADVLDCETDVLREVVDG
jgi:hypothetical protein